MTTTCPCDNNCICLPICRHKTFTSLYFECALLRQYFNEDQKLAYNHLQDILKPTRWAVETCNSDVMTKEN